MYCEHCGKEISKMDKFCEHCGASQKVQQNSTTENLKRTTTTFHDWICEHKKILILGALSIVLLVGILMGIDYAKTFINPLKYLTVELTGYNGQGDAHLHFDNENELILKLLGEKAAALDLVLDEDATEEMALMALGAYFQLGEEMDRIHQIFSLKLERTEENVPIQNGDTLTVTIEVDQEALKAYGFRTTKESFSKTYVVGKDAPSLPEPTKLDILSVLDLTIDGADGHGLLINNSIEKVISYDTPIDDYHSVRVYVQQNEYDTWQPYVRLTFHDETNEQVAAYGLTLNAEKTEGFSNGEEITLSIPEKEAENLSKFGLILQGTEKTISASGLRGMEEIDLIGALEYTFGGSDGYGYIQFVPGTYNVPVQNAENGEKTLTVEVTEDQNYDVYADYNGRPNVPVNLVVHLTENMESNIRIVVYAEPYDKLTNGDTVNFGIYEWSCEEDLEKLKSAGYTITTGHTAQVSGLLTPMEVKLSDILDYQIAWISDEDFDLTVGATKTTDLPENALGIQQLITTLGEKDISYPKYPVTFEFTTTDQQGNVQTHSITSDIYIQKDSWWNKVKFDMTQRQCRELQDYGIVVTEPYEMFDVVPVS